MFAGWLAYGQLGGHPSMLQTFLQEAVHGEIGKPTEYELSVLSSPTKTCSATCNASVRELAGAADGEGQMPAVIGPDHVVEPAALGVACDARFLLTGGWDDEVIRHVHQCQACSSARAPSVAMATCASAAV